MQDLQDNKQKLAFSALELFADRGFAGTSIRDIANATGLSLSNIYHHFGNKEGLLLAILETACTKLLDSLREAASQPGEPMERFQNLFRTHLELSCLLSREAKIFFLDEEHLSPEGHKINLKYQREILDIYRAQLKDLQKAGLAVFKSATIAAFNILGVLNWHLRWYRPDGDMSFEEIYQEVIGFIVHGISGPSTR